MFYFFKRRQNFGLASPHNHCLFKMSSRFTVSRLDCPPVRHHAYKPVTHRHHWFYGYAHPVFKQYATSVFAVIGNSRVFMHLTPYPMACQFPDNSISLRVTMFFNCATNITDMTPSNTIRDAHPQSFLCNLEQHSYFRLYIPDTKRVTRITAKTIKNDSTINRNYISVHENGLGIRNTVNNRIIHRSADTGREWMPKRIWIPFERRYCPVVSYIFLCQFIQLSSSNTRHD